jgi:hypothetical protein
VAKEQHFFSKDNTSSTMNIVTSPLSQAPKMQNQHTTAGILKPGLGKKFQRFADVIPVWCVHVMMRF